MALVSRGYVNGLCRLFVFTYCWRPPSVSINHTFTGRASGLKGIVALCTDAWFLKSSTQWACWDHLAAHCAGNICSAGHDHTSAGRRSRSVGGVKWAMRHRFVTPLPMVEIVPPVMFLNRRPEVRDMSIARTMSTRRCLSLCKM